MSERSERGIAALFGVLGAALLIVDAVFDFIGGVYYLAVGHGGFGLNLFDQGLIFLVVGLIVGFFAVYGRARADGSSVGVGAVLVVLAIVGWFVLGLGSGVLAILATVLVLVSGIVYLFAGR